MLTRRLFSQTVKPKRPSLIKRLWDTDHIAWQDLTLAQKAIYSVRSTGYTIVVFGGVCVFAGTFYFIYSESKTTSLIHEQYDRILALLNETPAVVRELGHVKGQYEVEWKTRNKIGHQFIRENDRNRLVLQFHVHGPFGMGTLYAEIEQDPRDATWKDHLVFVDVAKRNRRITVVDKREPVIIKKERKGWFGMNLVNWRS